MAVGGEGICIVRAARYLSPPVFSLTRFGLCWNSPWAVGRPDNRTRARAGALLVGVYAGEVVADKVFVALGDVVIVEGAACLLLVLVVDLLVRDLGRARVVGVGVGIGAALLAAGVVLTLHGDGCSCRVDATRGGVHRVGVSLAPARVWRALFVAAGLSLTLSLTLSLALP